MNLETSVSADQLINFPGYEILKDLGFLETNIKIDTVGLWLVGKADTKNNLKNFCEAFSITHESQV